MFEITHLGYWASDTLFAVATARVADVARLQGVSDTADTLVTVKVRMVNKAAETIVRDDFIQCSRGVSVSTVWTTAFLPIPIVEGSHILSCTCYLC